MMSTTGFFLRFLWWLAVTMLLVLPMAVYLQVKNQTMAAGREVKQLERDVLVLKKMIANQEQELAEAIDYRRIERLARRRGLRFIYENNNPVVNLRENP